MTLRTLGDFLRARGIDPHDIVAIRNALHPEDISSDFRTLDDVAQANAIQMLDRMQDGPRIAHDTRVLSFAALDNDRARLTGFRRFMMRPQGIVPGDIVYDYDAAHLLHAFIARATTPVFYDAFDEAGLEDALGTLIVQWPMRDISDIRNADAGDIIVDA